MNTSNLNTSDSKLFEFNLFKDITCGYHSLPVEFCLKEFLGWDEVKIKQFTKERKKAQRAAEKQYAKSQSICGIASNEGKSCCDKA